MKKITLGIAFPACDLPDESLDQAKSYFSHFHVELIILSDPDFSYQPFRNSPEIRAKEIEALFIDPNIEAILCARGGYGTNQVTEFIDYQLIKANPKPFIGYSDVSILLNRIHKESGIVTYHGPILKEFLKINNDAFTKEFISHVSNNFATLPDEEDLEECRIISLGEATGKFIGGNLTNICSSISTKDEACFTGNILFLEDIDEEIYQIDRLLTILIQSGRLEQVSGLIFGNFTKITNQKLPYQISLFEMISRKLKNLQIPILWNYPAGHSQNQKFLPIGRKAKLILKKTGKKFLNFH